MRATILIIGLMMLAGCSSGPEAQPAALAKSEEISRTAIGFSQCMRDRGYQVPDPTFNEDGLPVFQESQEDRVNNPAYQADRQECRAPLNDAIVAAGVPNVKGTPEQWLAFARCMRDHGVDMADPPQGRLVIDGSLYDSPAWGPAVEACKSNIPEGMHSILTERPGKKGGPGK